MTPIKTIFLIDGEHHPTVVLEAVEKLSVTRGWDPIALFFLGGTEKISEPDDAYSLSKPLIVPSNLLRDFSSALRSFQPEMVVDLSDEPVLSNSLRFQLISRALKAGVRYRGADFEFHPPLMETVLDKPSIAVFGTGKRCGKTAVSAHLAQYLKNKGTPPVVVAMGRGGPQEPQLIREPAGGIDSHYLLEELNKGSHAASDHFEDALVAGITTIGCRRCGGGMAGEPFVTNFLEGAVMANGLEEKLIILEGSGAALPPVKADINICVVSAAQPLDDSLGYLGTYRLLISDGVIITMCEEPCADKQKIAQLVEGIRSINSDLLLVKTIFRPLPLKSIENRKVFLTFTAPAQMGDILADYLQRKTGCVVRGWSNHLSRRKPLEEDLRKAPDFDVLLTELKAAAVEVAVRFAVKEGKEVVFMHNRPICVDDDSMEDFIERLLERVK